MFSRQNNLHVGLIEKIFFTYQIQKKNYIYIIFINNIFMFNNYYHIIRNKCEIHLNEQATVCELFINLAQTTRFKLT